MSISTRFGGLAFCALCAWLPSAQAASISYSQAIPLMTTNWTQDVTVPKFDPALGTLQRVILELEGTVQGMARFESLDPTATKVTTNFKANIRLRRPDLTDLVIALPKAQMSEEVSPYDGLVDFGGPSGRTYPNLLATQFESTILDAPLAPMDELLFVGAGQDVTLNVRAVGASTGSGSGNLLLLFNTSAEASVTVTYEYIPIPEPTTALLLASMTPLMLRRRSRR